MTPPVPNPPIRARLSKSRPVLGVREGFLAVANGVLSVATKWAIVGVGVIVGVSPVVISAGGPDVGTVFTFGKKPDNFPRIPLESFWLESMMIIRRMMPRKTKITRLDIENL